MKKIRRDTNGFGIIELLLIIVIVAAAGFICWFVWHARATTNKANEPARTTNATSKTKKLPPAASYVGWQTYTNAELGLTFKYPKDWGTATLSREALNNPQYETNLPYSIKFSNVDAPTATIVPTDWKFTPPRATEWNYPLAWSGLEKDDDAGVIPITQDDTTIVSIHYGSFDGEIRLQGIKLVQLSKMKATQVELQRYDPYESKPGCLETRKNSSNSDQEYATVACYSQAYRDNFVQALQSFTSL